MADPFENIVELPFLKDQELEEQQSPFSKQISLNPYQTGGTVGGSTVVKSEVRIISKFTAGEAITKNDALYFKAADSKVYKTDADAAATTDNFIGFAVNNITSGELGDVQLSGRMNGFSGLTAGTIYFLSGTAGALSTTAGTISRRALLATAADEGIIIKDDFGTVTVKTGNATATDGNAVTITHGLGQTPKSVRIFANKTGTNSFSVGAYNGTTQGCIYFDGTNYVSNTSNVAAIESTGAKTYAASWDSTTITLTPSGSISGTIVVIWDAFT